MCLIVYAAFRKWSKLLYLSVFVQASDLRQRLSGLVAGTRGKSELPESQRIYTHSHPDSGRLSSTSEENYLPHTHAQISSQNSHQYFPVWLWAHYIICVRCFHSSAASHIFSLNGGIWGMCLCVHCEAGSYCSDLKGERQLARIIAKGCVGQNDCCELASGGRWNCKVL